MIKMLLYGDKTSFRPPVKLGCFEWEKNCTAEVFGQPFITLFYNMAPVGKGWVSLFYFILLSVDLFNCNVGP